MTIIPFPFRPPPYYVNNQVVNPVMPSAPSQMTKGLPTGSLEAVLNGTDNGTSIANMLWTVNYYDDKGRVIQTNAQHYLGGSVNAANYDQISNGYDFTNAVTQTIRNHYNTTSGSNVAVSIANSYDYDHMGRKINSWSKINDGDKIVLSKADYNEAGQLKIKSLHSVNGTAPFLQAIDYRYNERGWLSQINDPGAMLSPTKYFSLKLNYNQPQYGALANYNGNISEEEYNAQFSGNQHVTYDYDALNRLTKGNSTAGFSETDIGYDKGGNLTTLTRSNYGTVNYEYDSSTGSQSNQLTGVSGFISGSYQYDGNGNKKYENTLLTGGGIPNFTKTNTVSYNYLNLPQSISGTQNINYVYTATGQKLRKIVNGSSVTEYIGGIQYKPDGTIDFIQTEEGRANRSGTNYVYEYTLTDHLGNNRVTFDASNGKVGEDDYYPFGFNVHRQQNAGNKYLYNKKELQEELNEYDYGARFYDAVIGRWSSVDPMSHMYFPYSPYNYTANNPVKYIDPTGMVVEFAEGTNRKDKREFMKQQRALNRGSETAKAQWKQLKKSDNVHTIHVNEKTEQGTLQSSHTIIKGKIDTENGNGSDIYVNLSDKPKDGPNMVEQAHEEAHAVDYDNGTDRTVKADVNLSMSTEQIYNALQKAAFETYKAYEIQAGHMENIIRAELDPTGNSISLRQTHSGELKTSFMGRPSNFYIEFNIIKDGYRYYKNQKH